MRFSIRVETMLHAVSRTESKGYEQGVVVLDRSQLQPSERLYVALVGRFRYGREEDEILGMSLCREIYLGHTQLCPDALEVPGDAPGPSRSPGRPLYSMQLGNVHRRLLEALGDAAVPFRFEYSITF
ncbi:conserved hypothetical protein [Ixodes scapularis]|uniref:Arrestin-like N-terminal domain-containing protein n=1 Tax=Ixodes scapularis TaxID=6945 RepID=B7QIE1_IXOSC|nr:conserved hypothetical protein [Ixodes scapularis]|eukprot:XP_002414948.1 conserved hypothetical protein [Ixodes scapularis]